MNGATYTKTTNRLVLLAKTAEDLMTINPVSLRERATVEEAMAFLGARGFGGAPVIDDAGKPIGFVGKTDLLQHAAHAARRANGGRSGHDGAELMRTTSHGNREEFCTCPTTVRDIMRPAIVAVPRTASVAQVVKKMIARRVHRVFVIDKTGALIGVISSLDVLQALCD
jgi:CBS domain-containing protein